MRSQLVLSLILAISPTAVLAQSPSIPSATVIKHAKKKKSKSSVIWNVAAPTLTEEEKARVTMEDQEPVVAKAKYTWTLSDVIRIADQNNPDLNAARANYRAASKRVIEALSGYLPQVDVSGNFEQTTLPTPSAGSVNNLGTSLPYTGVMGSVRQTVFDFGKVLDQILANRDYRKSANQERASIKLDVNLAVEKAFFNVALTQKLVEVAKTGVLQFDEVQRRMVVLVKTGTRPSFDLSQANLELAKSRLALISARNSRDVAKVALITLMGVPNDTSFAIKENPPTVFKHDPKKLDLSKLTAEAFDSRPELKSNQFAVAAAEKLHSRAIKDFLPTVDAEAWYGRFMQNYPSPIANSWGAGLTLTWNIFNGFDTTAHIGEMYARMNEQQAQLDKERDAISAEVANSLLEFQRSDINMIVAKQSLDFAKINSQLAQKRYDANVATFLELLVADTSLLSAQAEDVKARYQREIALASLQRAVNGPLE